MDGLAPDRNVVQSESTPLRLVSREMAASELSRRELLACSLALWIADVGKVRRRNVLFISIDDLNHWVFSSAAHLPRPLCPNLRVLAQRATTFTNAHCAAPACNPSRTAVMTGIAPHKSGVYLNDQEWRTSPVLEAGKTLPGLLRTLGYEVLGCGKLFHSDPDPASWDAYWPSKGKVFPGSPMPPKRDLPLSGLNLFPPMDWGPLDVSVEEMGDWQLAQWASRKLSEPRERPLFLGCGFVKPHLPWYVPREFFELYDAVELPDPPPIQPQDELPKEARSLIDTARDHLVLSDHLLWRRAVTGYLAAISFTDRCLGVVLKALEESGRRDETLVIVWSDHGFHFGEKGHWRKFSLWEEATRSPLLFVDPDQSQETVNNEPVSLLDITPTVLDLLELPALSAHSGESLVPLLAGRSARHRKPVVTTHGFGNHSVRTRRWRYTQYRGGGRELYDHRDDPHETVNLALRPAFSSTCHSLGRLLPTQDAPSVPRVRQPRA